MNKFFILALTFLTTQVFADTPQENATEEAVAQETVTQEVQEILFPIITYIPCQPFPECMVYQSINGQEGLPNTSIQEYKQDSAPDLE